MSIQMTIAFHGCVDYLVVGITNLRNDVRGVLGLSEIVTAGRGGNFKTMKIRKQLREPKSFISKCC